MATGGAFSVPAAAPPPGIGIRRISGGGAGTGMLLVFMSSGRVALLAYSGRGFRRRLAAGPGLFSSVGEAERRETERLKRDPACR
jgi:hypothetical protein